MSSYKSAFSNLCTLPTQSRRDILQELLDTLIESDIRYLYNRIQKHAYIHQSSKALIKKPMILKPVNLDPFQDVADELIIHILSYIHSPSSLSSCALVNRRFHRLLTDNVLWKKVCGVKSFAPVHLNEKQVLMKSRIPRQIPVKWKSVFKENYQTHLNWMQGRYSVQEQTHSRNHGPLCLSFDASKAVSVGRDSGRVWNLKTGQAYFAFQDAGAISTALITPEFILTASTDHSIKIWGSDGVCKNTLLGHTGEVCSLAYSAPFIASGSEDSTIRIWNQDGSFVKEFRGHSGAVTSLTIFKDTILSGSTDHTARLWDSTNVVFRGHSGTVFCVSMDHRYICSGSQDTTIRVYHSKSHKIHKILTGHHRGVVCLQFDETKLVSGSADNCILVWNLKSGHAMYILKQHQGTIWNLFFNQSVLVTSSLDASVLIWTFNDNHENGHLIDGDAMEQE